MKKASELFSGANSSLKKTFDKATEKNYFESGVWDYQSSKGLDWKEEIKAEVEHCSERNCPECQTALLKVSLEAIETEVEELLSHSYMEMDGYLVSRNEVLAIIKKHMV